jgi:hypothetical protein
MVGGGEEIGWRLHVRSPRRRDLGVVGSGGGGKKEAIVDGKEVEELQAVAERNQ